MTLDTHAAPGSRYRVSPRGHSYWVVDPGGRSVAAYDTRKLATEEAKRLQAEADRSAKRGPRPCMCCGRTFDSAGIHNRLCAHCRIRGDSGSLSIPATAAGKVRRAAS
ncbi:MAG: hypothetical protein BGP11_05495 [Rhodobacterales bacterium 65-51]|uniref:hypothetical protein n=1 Tax=uncultured Gemmobacter sp. TaxID=1095917 RepID=UPI000965C8D4|nr:hypothetical protein [uncultured Gemmobacter sp.]OJY33177.1 MAG: hypothetical protein BGP11_05495 [Rhodobacterales bacterium 65-51]